LPATARSVSLNVTVAGSSVGGYLTLFPAAEPLPATSTINYRTGQTRANNAVIPLGPGGLVSIFCGQGSGSTHVILDVNGYFE
jgi:hypothetical protein